MSVLPARPTVEIGVGIGDKAGMAEEVGDTEPELAGFGPVPKQTSSTPANGWLWVDDFGASTLAFTGFTAFASMPRNIAPTRGPRLQPARILGTRPISPAPSSVNLHAHLSNAHILPYNGPPPTPCNLYFSCKKNIHSVHRWIVTIYVCRWVCCLRAGAERGGSRNVR